MRLPRLAFPPNGSSTSSRRRRRGHPAAPAPRRRRQAARLLHAAVGSVPDAPLLAPVSPQTARRAARLDEWGRLRQTFGIVAELGDDLIVVGTYQRTDAPMATRPRPRSGSRVRRAPPGGIGSMSPSTSPRSAARWACGASPSTLPENRRMLAVRRSGLGGRPRARGGRRRAVVPHRRRREDPRGPVPPRAPRRARSVERLLHPGSIAVIGAGATGLPRLRRAPHLVEGG